VGTIVLQTGAVLLASTLLAGSAAGDPAEKPEAEVLFARQLEAGKPVEPGTRFSPGKLYCWTKLKSRESHYTIKHHWIRNGRRVWLQPIQVGARLWVTWSHFNVTPGAWTVKVTDETGLLIQSASFTVE
jgi:hypothetical protein